MIIETISARWRLAPAMALSVVLLLTPAAAGAAQTAKPGGGEVSTRPAVSSEAWEVGRRRLGRDRISADEAIVAYWTPDRMAKATPVEKAPFFRRATERFEAAERARKDQARDGARRRGAETDAGSVEFAPTAPARALQGSGGATAAAVPAATNPNLPYSHATARTNGKVFFSLNGGNYSCSAAVINSEGKDTVWTAGHCVHGGQGSTWASNWSFVPAYDDDLANPRPYGTWTANHLWSKTAWTSSSDFVEDMGVAIMNTRNGHHIVSYFGGHGFRVNAGKNVYVRPFGYPAESPFDGGNLYRCQGTTSPEWTVLWWSSDTLKVPCDMTRGSSGGPWLHGYDGSYGYLNGVNSRIDKIVGPTIMLSPYFDDSALSLYNATRYL